MTGRRPDADAYGWITALRAPAIRKLMADDGPLQLSLFDQQDLAEITSDDFPGERLVACRNPNRADFTLIPHIKLIIINKTLTVRYEH